MFHLPVAPLLEQVSDPIQMPESATVLLVAASVAGARVRLGLPFDMC